MAHKNEAIKAKAEDLYCYSDFNQSEICEICEISEKTLRDWRDKGGWEDIKKSNAITTPKIVQKLQERLYTLSQDDSVKEDRLVKLAASIDKLRGQDLFLHNYIKVFKEFTDFLFTKGNENKTIAQAEGELKINGSEAGKLLNLHMKDFIHSKIHGNR